MKVNTEKGAQLFTGMDIYAQEQTVQEMYAKNHKTPAPFPAQRNKIFSWIHNEGLTATAAMQRAVSDNSLE